MELGKESGIEACEKAPGRYGQATLSEAHKGRRRQKSQVSGSVFRLFSELFRIIEPVELIGKRCGLWKKEKFYKKLSLIFNKISQYG